MVHRANLSGLVQSLGTLVIDQRDHLHRRDGPDDNRLFDHQQVA